MDGGPALDQLWINVFKVRGFCGELEAAIVSGTVLTPGFRGSGLVFPGLLGGGRGWSLSPVLGTGGSYLPLYIVTNASLECRSD